MLQRYIAQILPQATFKSLEDGCYFEAIPHLDGVHAHESMLETCKTEHESALGDWILYRARHGMNLPVIDGIDLNFSESA